MSADNKIKTNIQNLTLNSSFDALSKWHDPDISKCKEEAARRVQLRAGSYSNYLDHGSNKQTNYSDRDREQTNYSDRDRDREQSRDREQTNYSDRDRVDAAVKKLLRKKG